MPTLAELQSHFHDVVLGGSPDALEHIVADDRLGHAARLNIYRNNTTILLREALAANFPVTAQLVGADFFAHLARAFVRTHPPQSPCLFEYSNAFAAFIETFPGCTELPYLSDVARLEWALDEVQHAADAPTLPPSALAHVAPSDYARLTFTFHPAARIVSSPYPIHAIWALHQDGAPGDDQGLSRDIDFTSGAEAVMITRPALETKLSVLSEGDAIFFEGLRMNATLESAFAEAHRHNPSFDVTRALTTLLLSGALADFALS